MSTLPKLPRGLRGFTDSTGRWVCTGSQMGRSNDLPPSPATDAPKLRLVRLRMSSCGCYDAGGAYWGHGVPLYWAVTTLPHPAPTYCGPVSLFVRAPNRTAAKREVRSLLPAARFFN